MDWDKLKYFYHVVETGSFTRAAEKLNMSQSALSRSIQTLEKQLNTQLLHRDSRGLPLTLDGQIWFGAIKEMLGLIDGVYLLRECYSKAGSYKLKVSSTSSLISEWLVFTLPSFLEQNPEINIELKITSPGEIEEFRSPGIAVLPFSIPYHTGIERPLQTYHYALYASEAYLNKAGQPQDQDDLGNHKLIDLRSEEIINHIRNEPFPHSLKKETGELYTPHLVADSCHTLLHLVKAGMGIAAFIEESPLIKEAGLIRVLPHLRSHPVPIRCFIPEYLANSELVDDFCEHLIQHV